MKRRRILVLTPRYPYPVVGGDRLRIFEICSELAKYHDLTLLSLCESEHELNSPLPNDGVFRTIERVLLPKWRSILNSVAALPTSTPLQIAYYKSREFAGRVRALLPHHDVCLAHLIRTGQYVRNSELPVVLEMTDAISMNYERVRNLGKIQGFKSLVYRFESGRLLKYERGILEDFDVMTLVSQFDRDFLLNGKRNDRLLVCSNGVDLKKLPFRQREESEPIAAFIGNMTSIQNLDACLFFAQEVLPVVRKRINICFRVVGRIKERDAEKLRAIEGVEVLSNVSDVAEAVGNARVGVAPIRLGAGVQNKVLEYMALGLPVITSPVALEGFRAREGEDLLVASTPEEYAAQFVRLWDDTALRAKLATNGFAYVKSQHSWSSQLEPLVDAVSELSGVTTTSEFDLVVA